MNRIFGRGKPKGPPPNLTDCIGSVSVCLSNFSDVWTEINNDPDLVVSSLVQ